MCGNVKRARELRQEAFNEVFEIEQALHVCLNKCMSDSKHSCRVF